MNSNEDILSIILKHPFFRNPNNYYVRRITIIKYLKKKGVDISDKTFSDRVDSILMNIKGVSRAGLDGYSFKKE